MSTDPKFYSEDIKNITQIEFSIFTNKEIKSYSSVSNDPFGINLPESYENYEPKKGGLVDLRLGTCDPYLNCTTCGLNTNDCPGHFGHTVLAEPVFHYGFLLHLKTLLQCICLQCSKLLVEKSETLYKKLSHKKSESRFKEIKIIVKNVNYCYYCGTPVGKIKKEINTNTSTIKLILEKELMIQNVDEKTGSVYDETKKFLKPLTPRDCYNILRNLSDIDCFLLGFNPKIARPEDLIIQNFPIPPVCIRPTAKIDFMQSSTMEDSLTLKIADIITWNKRVKVQLDKEIINNEIASSSQFISDLLQYHIVTYFDNESIPLPKSEFKSGGKPTKSICDRIKGKTGRVRSNLMGKRVDFSARSVITSDPYINIDEVGVPKKIAMELTIPEEVTPFNKDKLSKLVLNGRDIYPGANFVFSTIFRDGKSEIRKTDLRYRKKSIRLQLGDIVERHSVNGDYILFNRQPTLHKPSMMGHKIHVLDRDDANTFRVNVSVTKPYNADFDGDEMNIYLAQSLQARNELKQIANVKLQIIGAKDSNPIIGCVQDALSGAYKMTLPQIKILGSEASNFLCNTSSDTKNEIEKNKYYTGHEIFSYIIPYGINKKDKKIEIVNGILKSGLLDKNSLSTEKNSIIHFIWDKYGPNKTRRFIDDTQRLILNFLMSSGLSIGFHDCIIPMLIEDKVRQLINNIIIEYKVKLTEYENDIDQLDIKSIENLLSSILSAFSADLVQIIEPTLNFNNNLYLLWKSGAKGKPENVQKIMGCMGNIMIEGSRIKKKVENRALPIFHKDDDTPEARGFIKSSLFDGVKSFEFFYDAMAGREGLIETAIKSVTWETPIIIIDNKQPKYIEIGRLIDELLEKNLDKVQYFKDQNMELLDTNNIYIPTMDYQGNVSWGAVTAITRHDPGSVLYEIKTKSGRSVIVTASKSLLIWNKETNEFKEMMTTDIKIGDFVPTTVLLSEPPIIQTESKFINYFSDSQNNTLFKLDYMNGIIIGNYIIDNNKKSMPEESFIAPLNFIIGLLQSYYSKKGYIDEDKIELDIISEKMGNNISILCSRIGVFCTITSNKIIISKPWINKFINTLNYKATIYKDTINIKNDIILDEIIEINFVDIINHPKVYDLTIPSTFNFGLANGLQVRDTAKTGYIQRQLIKGLEDIIIKYDNTNRTSKNVIIQYVYGENGINQSCQTELVISCLTMNNTEIDEKFGMTKKQIELLEKKLKIKNLEKFNKEYTNKIKNYRNKLRMIQCKTNNNYKILEEKYMLPINLFRLTQDYSNNKEYIELTPQEINDSIEEFLNDYEIKLLPGLKKTDKYLINDDRSLKFLLEIALHDFLAPVKCIFTYGLSKNNLKKLWEEIKLSFIKALVEPGEMVGIIAAQSIGEPTTQMGLNKKHSAGASGSKNSVNSGVSRIEELLHYSKDIKTPQMTIYFNDDICSDKSKINKIDSYFKYLSIKELIDSAEIYYDVGRTDTLSKKIKDDNVLNPFFVNNNKADLASLPFIFRIKLNMEKLHDKETTMLDIKTKFISYWHKNFVNIKNMKKNEKDIFTKITRCAILNNNNYIIHIRFNMSSFNYNILTEFLKIVLNKITLKGIDNIEYTEMKHENRLIFDEESGNINNTKEYVVYTSGINLEKLKYFKGINMSRTFCNDIDTTYRLYGIEAARHILLNEFMTTYIGGGSKINHNHMSVLIDMMTHMGSIISIDRHGLSKIDSEPIAKASFEKTMDHFINAAIFNEKDHLKSVSSRIMMGRVIPGGTGAFDLLLDTEKLENSEYTQDENGGRITFIELEEEPLLIDLIKNDTINNDFFVPK